MLECSQIRITLKQGIHEASILNAARAKVAAMLSCQPHDLSFLELRRKSIDARKKQDVHFIVTVRATLREGLDEQTLLSRLPKREQSHIRSIDPKEPSFPQPVPHALRPKDRPVVVGAGCAGLFAALALAQAGLEPLLIEMGDDATRRTRAVETFNSTGKLDPSSNIQFGLGGAGTFSDGKLNTGTKNPIHRLVLQTLVDAGAPREILVDAKPHIGSDILPAVVTNIVQRIEDAGGTVLFRTRLIDLQRSQDGSVSHIIIDRSGRSERIQTAHLVLACGHSARSVFSLLAKRGVRLARKEFAMGVRIEHLQRDIDRALYGPAAGHPALGAAPYSLVAHLPNGRSLFSFCMCPGGEVVAAASEEGGVVTNGASLNARAGVNANAALLVNIRTTDLPGDDPLAGIELQRACERKAFELGGGEYRAPAQLVGDFLDQTPSCTAGRIKPTYPRGVTWGEIDDTLPVHVIETLRMGIPALGKKLRGYDDPEAVLTGVETRSSSPVTIVREGSCVSVNTPGLYPCGEGAGYAGGIMSAATDGVRCAQAVIDSLGSIRQSHVSA